MKVLLNVFTFWVLILFGLKSLVISTKSKVEASLFNFNIFLYAVNTIVLEGQVWPRVLLVLGDTVLSQLLRSMNSSSTSAGAYTRYVSKLASSSGTYEFWISPPTLDGFSNGTNKYRKHYIWIARKTKYCKTNSTCFSISIVYS